MYELYLKRETDPTAARRAWQQREGAILAFDAFATEEIPRLQEKIWEMQSRKITRISYETLGPGFHNLGARERALYAAIRATALKMSSAGEQSRHSPNEEASRAIALNRSQGETIP